MTATWVSKLQSMIQSRMGAPVQSAARDVLNFAVTRQPARNSEKALPTGCRVLSVDDIARALRRYSSDPEFRGERRVPIAGIAALTQLSRPTIYAAQRGQMSEGTRVILSQIIPQIDNDEICFRRVGREWLVDYRRPPAVLRPAQYKIVPAADWQEWGPCRTCGGHKWTAVIMNGALHKACRQCLPPPEWAGMGIRIAPRSTRNCPP